MPIKFVRISNLILMAKAESIAEREAAEEIYDIINWFGEHRMKVLVELNGVPMPFAVLACQNKSIYKIILEFHNEEDLVHFKLTWT